MRKLIVTAALLVAIVSAKAQQNNIQQQVTITKKCPNCKDKWDYVRTGWVEQLTNPDFNTGIIIDWEKKEIRVINGDTYPFTFYTNDREWSQTYVYGGQKLKMYFNSKAEYIGHEFEN